MKHFPKRSWTSLAASARFIRCSLGNDVALAQRVERRWRQALSDREILSRGRCEDLYQTIEIHELDGREWRGAKVDWEHSLLVYRGPKRRSYYVITDIELERSKVLNWFRADRADDKVEACVRWLRDRLEKAGRESKKILKPDAMNEIQRLRVREFAKAYGLVYQNRRRGRPKKEQ